MVKLIAGLVIFFVVHSISIVARDWRERTVTRIGPAAWKALYTVASLVGFLMIVGG